MVAIAALVCAMPEDVVPRRAAVVVRVLLEVDKVCESNAEVVLEGALLAFVVDVGSVGAVVLVVAGDEEAVVVRDALDELVELALVVDVVDVVWARVDVVAVDVVV